MWLECPHSTYCSHQLHQQWHTSCWRPGAYWGESGGVCTREVEWCVWLKLEWPGCICCVQTDGLPCNRFVIEKTRHVLHHHGVSLSKHHILCFACSCHGWVTNPACYYATWCGLYAMSMKKASHSIHTWAESLQCTSIIPLPEVTSTLLPSLTRRPYVTA